MPNKLKRIEAKVSTILDREGKYKETIHELREELRVAKSNAHFTHLSGSHNTSQNQLLQSMIAENRQRKTMLEEARLKSEQTQIKAYE